MDLTKNRFYVGTARGALLYTSDKPNNFKISKSSETVETTAISNGRTTDEIILGYASGIAATYDTENNKYIKTWTDLEGEGKVTGVGCVKNSIIIGESDGIINCLHGKKNDYFSINLEENGTMDALVCNGSRESVIGTGGEFNDYKLWNLDTQQCIFKAKSLGHDELQLPIPTSVRGIAFFPSDPYLGACATKEGHVLLYDDRAQRRPVLKYFEQKASFSCIATAYRDRQCFAGTTKGYMQWIDLKTGKCLKTYTSYTGSVTSIVCDPVEPYVASTSLDRFLRVHHMETKELVYKSYMKQSLTKLLVKPVVKDETEETTDKSKEDKNIDVEYEKLFSNMEKIEEKIKKKSKKLKRDSVNCAETPSKKVKKKKIKEG